MQIRFGFELKLLASADTAAVVMLQVHPSRRSRLAVPDRLSVSPDLALRPYSDGFGNLCTRFVLPAGVEITVTTDGVIEDSGRPDPIFIHANAAEPHALPEEALVFLLPSRYCDSDSLAGMAWATFGRTKPGWERVQAICDFVHARLEFGYRYACGTRTAGEAMNERKGVCRDFAHTAISLCRAMNIPARYCTGYLSDIGTPPPYAVGDFAAWFEAWIGGRWQVFDPRNNVPRMGRILMARGRDASDVAIATTFGPNTLEVFRVWTDENSGGDVAGTTD